MIVGTIVIQETRIGLVEIRITKMPTVETNIVNDAYDKVLAAAQQLNQQALKAYAQRQNGKAT